MTKKVSPDMEAQARRMLSSWILKRITSEDYILKLLSKQKYHDLVMRYIKYEVAHETGVSRYRCEQIHDELLHMWLNDEDYKAKVAAFLADRAARHEEHARSLVAEGESDYERNAAAIMSGEAQPIQRDTSRTVIEKTDSYKPVTREQVFHRADRQRDA